MARKTMEKTEVLLELPIGDAPDSGYENKQAVSGKISLAPRSSRMNIQAQLGADAAVAFVRVRNGLRASHATLTGGRPVWTNVDTIRWMMERVVEQLEG